MKNFKIISGLIAAFFLIMGSCEDSGDNSALPTMGLVAYYPFESVAIDQVTGAEATVIGASLDIDSSYQFITSYNFDGNDDYILCQDSNFVVDSFISVSVWIKTDDLKKQFIIDKYDYRIDAGFHLALIDGIPRFNGRDRNEEYIRCIGEDPINDLLWHHLVGIVNKNTWELWVDGKKIASTSNFHTEVNISCDQHFSLGCFLLGEYGDHHYYRGYMDRIRIYNRPLSESEVIRLYLE